MIILFLNYVTFWDTTVEDFNVWILEDTIQRITPRKLVLDSSLPQWNVVMKLYLRGTSVLLKQNKNSTKSKQEQTTWNRNQNQKQKKKNTPKLYILDTD